SPTQHSGSHGILGPLPLSTLFCSLPKNHFFTLYNTCDLDRFVFWGASIWCFPCPCAAEKRRRRGWMSKEQKDLKKKGKGGGAICMSREVSAGRPPPRCASRSLLLLVFCVQRDQDGAFLWVCISSTTSPTQQGMVDDQFRQLQSLQEDGGSASGFVAEVATLLIDDADRIINDIGSLLDAGGT
uniref:Histidine-containing phosphotransfer protein n=5 Tax=Aegilops tauschii subsp. strangulata TaxID=200361 RepID=A0A453MRC3_AEGTS